MFFAFCATRIRQQKGKNMTIASTSSLVDKLFLDAKVLEGQRKPNQAIQVYQKILSVDPKNEQAILSISRLFLHFKEYQNAVKSLKYYLNITSQKSNAYYNLGLAYCYLRQGEQAISAFKSAIVANPSYAQAYEPLYSSLERLRKLDELPEFLKAYKNKPVGEIQWMLAKLKTRSGHYQEALKLMEKAEKLTINELSRSKFYTDFGTFLHHLKRFDEAMQMHQRAQNIGAQVASDVRDTITDEISAQTFSHFSSQKVKGWKNFDINTENDPIFIVGFPRSGTTLMEQILSTLPNLRVSDEVPVLKRCIDDSSKILNKSFTYPTGFDSLSREDITSWRKEYYTRMQHVLPELKSRSDKTRIVDKLPAQIKFLGYMQRFFPKSPVLVMIRDPRDVCLSCFFQNFTPNQTTIHYYNLKQAFEFYAKIMKLYLYLRDQVQMPIMQVKYEDLCSDFEPNAKKIISHISETWNEEILQFHQSKHVRFTITPSYNSVAKPINQKAIGNWQNYAKFIKPLEYIIEPYLKEFGYELST